MEKDKYYKANEKLLLLQESLLNTIWTTIKNGWNENDNQIALKISATGKIEEQKEEFFAAMCVSYVTAKIHLEKHQEEFHEKLNKEAEPEGPASQEEGK